MSTCFDGVVDVDVAVGAGDGCGVDLFPAPNSESMSF
jgi:hypothetical protein